MTNSGEPTWEDEYKSLLASIADRQQNTLGSAADNRKHPRFRTKTGFVTIQIVLEYEVLDVSTSGFSFVCDHLFPTGIGVTANFEKVISLEAKVVSCIEIQPAMDGDRERYRVGCEFSDDTPGLQMLISIYRMGNIELNIES